MASLKDILVKIQAQSQFESAKKGIQQKLAVEKNPTKKVQLTRVSEATDRFAGIEDAINTRCAKLENLFREIDGIGNELAVEYEDLTDLKNELDAIYDAAAEFGLEGQLPQAFNDAHYHVIGPGDLTKAKDDLYDLAIFLQEFDIPYLNID